VPASAAGIVAAMEPTERAPRRAVPLREALRFWVRLGFINFGGPSGQIAIMHDELVERRRWIDEPRFFHALNFAMLLPGPEAHQLAIYVGWLLNGAAGAIAAGTFFLLPALVLMLGLSWVYAVHGDVAWIAAVFAGLGWGVVGIVAAALVRIGGRAIRGARDGLIAAGAFVALFALGVPFPVVILVAGAVGAVVPVTHAVAPVDEVPDLGRPAVAPTARRTARVLAVGLAAWLLPLAVVGLAVGGAGVIRDEALFFALMSLVTFGGAYAVLAYVNQAAVLRFGWLTSGEMAVGLSLAETTPGPLILTVVFVAFVAAYRDPGALTPAIAGLVGGLVTAWATFVPSFLWIFLGAPSVERLRESRRLAAALSAITAAVVGVIANLASVFAIGVLFERHAVRRLGWHDLALPVLASADGLAIVVAVAGFVAIWRYRVNVVWVVGLSGLVGLLRWLA
jgi:chromate transporter